ncbi:hypothetical protein ASZ90_004835 [hydrocarbon metagenome]|uniref:Uncharacterized protein n=1 Tax=hydrocarbon metagenome TaxID=938273 RepID=A0A0W8FWX6_9ZZZZ
MNSLKQKFALFLAKKKYFSKKLPSQNFKGIISGALKVLIVLPDTAEDILKSMDIPAYFRINKKKVILLVHERLQHVAREEYSYDVIVFNDESKTKLGLPKKEFAKELSKMKFDAVLDLNRANNLFQGILANIPESKITAGFKKSKADELYNLQIANNQNNAEISYRNFLNSVQMF